MISLLKYRLDGIGYLFQPDCPNFLQRHNRVLKILCYLVTTKTAALPAGLVLPACLMIPGVFYSKKYQLPGFLSLEENLTFAKKDQLNFSLKKSIVLFQARSAASLSKRGVVLL